MATYTKETALYDTGKIGNDIASAGQTATNYLTTISGTSGISVHNANDTDNFVNMNSEGVGIYQDGTNVAQFGATTRIGADSEASITIAEDSLTGVGSNNKEFFKFAGDGPQIEVRHLTSAPYRPLKDYPYTQGTGFSVILDHTPGTIEVEVYFERGSSYTIDGFVYGTSSTKSKSITSTEGNSYSLYVSYDGNRTFSDIRINKSSNDYSILHVSISDKTTDYAPVYSLGGGTVVTGAYALAEGYETIASGNYSHAEGYLNTTASGEYSHAEGKGTTASGQGSHAEGLWTTASGAFSHTEGTNTKAKGSNSHAGGSGTVAAGLCQTVIGQSNIEESVSSQLQRGTYVLIIGNGTSTASNALTVDWNGNVDIASGAKYKINGTALAASDVGAVPTTRKVNNKALSSNITLSASDVSAVPTTRTVNSKALSSNITLTASDVSAVPTTRTVNNKALSADITLSASDVSAVPTTRTVNSKALSADISLTASDVGAVPTTTTVNGQALSANVADADYVTEEGSKASGSVTWTYRKWNSGKIEAWCGYTFASSASTVWASPIRYWDKTINIPSGIFSAAPRVMATSQSTQYWVGGCTASNATTASIRVLTAASGSMALNVNIYAIAG